MDIAYNNISLEKSHYYRLAPYPGFSHVVTVLHGKKNCDFLSKNMGVRYILWTPFRHTKLLLTINGVS